MRHLIIKEIKKKFYLKDVTKVVQFLKMFSFINYILKKEKVFTATLVGLNSNSSNN